MSTPHRILNPQPFPWDALERLTRVQIEKARNVRTQLAKSFGLEPLLAATSMLLAAPVQVHIRAIDGYDARPPLPGVEFALSAPGHPTVLLTLEPALAAKVVTAAMGQATSPWLDFSQKPVPELTGAAAAIAVTLARRACADALVAWRIVDPPAFAEESAVTIHAALVIDGDLFAISVSTSLSVFPSSPIPFDRPALASLGTLPLCVPLVGAVALASRTDLDSLVPGSAWAPGASNWMLSSAQQGQKYGQGALVNGAQEQGIPVEVHSPSRNQSLEQEMDSPVGSSLEQSSFKGNGSGVAGEAHRRPYDRRARRAPQRARSTTTTVALGQPLELVVTPGRLFLPWDVSTVPDDNLSSSDSDSNPLAFDTIPEALADTPVVIRVEVASVTLAAREWAALRPGDVLSTNAPLGQSVTLRAGGVAIARGELCQVEGEIAVRILERKEP